MRVPFVVLLAFAATLFAQTNRPKTFQDEYDAWFKAHPLPLVNASPEQRRAFDQEIGEASAQWVRDWPDDPRAWRQRFRSSARLKSTPDQQLEEIGDKLLKVAKEHPARGFRFVPFQTEVAEIWSERHIRPERCLALLQEAVREDKQAESDNPSAARHSSEVFVQGLFHTFELEAFLAIDLRKFAVAAVVANSNGQKPDALLYYSEAFREYPEDSSTETHARQLWKELGGSDEAFNTWASTIARIDRKPPETAQDRSPWLALNKPLTAFRGSDTTGKLWTSEDLKGKKTLINIWATWCRPCQDELPAVQSIFDQWKNRNDVQLLTVSVDMTLPGSLDSRSASTIPSQLSE